MIAREIEGRTIYLMLSKPIRRGTIILGKFIGFSMAITLIVAIETLILLGILGIQGLFPDMLFLSAIVATWLKLELLLALIIFFSSWTSPVMSMFMTISSYII
jgi:ABC-type transport system involved in multi-copper enzyme maturation permease subunit